nr:hypothetical protein [Tanacetum cinerariifolium]
MTRKECYPRRDDFGVEVDVRVLEVDDLSLVDGVFDGAFGGEGEEDVVMGEGVVVTSSSLEMLTNSCLGKGYVWFRVLKILVKCEYLMPAGGGPISIRRAPEKGLGPPEIWGPHGFRKDADDVVDGRHFFDRDMSFLDIIMKKVVTNFDMFGSRVLHRVFANAFIVAHDRDVVDSYVVVDKSLFHP